MAKFNVTVEYDLMEEYDQESLNQQIIENISNRLYYDVVSKSTGHYQKEIEKLSRSIVVNVANEITTKISQNVIGNLEDKLESKLSTDFNKLLEGKIIERVTKDLDKKVTSLIGSLVKKEVKNILKGIE